MMARLAFNCILVVGIAGEGILLGERWTAEAALSKWLERGAWPVCCWLDEARSDGGINGCEKDCTRYRTTLEVCCSVMHGRVAMNSLMKRA